DVFMTAASPGVIAQFLRNTYYPTLEDYLYALADAMRPEYRAIVDAGFALQLDCPDLTGLGSQVHTTDLGEFRANVQRRVEVLNHALDGLPPEQLRLHLCW